MIICLVAAIVVAAPHLLYRNRGESTSRGTVGNGSMANSHLLRYRAGNASYFSPVSYFLMGNCYVHSRLYRTLEDTYAECKNTCQGYQFRVMECSGKMGGKLTLHKTHQNGLSVDFMVPKVKYGRQSQMFDRIGLWHYLLEFDEEGRLELDQNIRIDFETLGKHILALDDASKANGLFIKKVILKINLKDDLFQTVPGREIRRRGISFAKSLPPAVDRLHDDHYHVDFGLR